MAKRFDDISRPSRGFTLMELLAGLAVMAILFALIAPLAVGLMTNLQMMRLDGDAKSIYVAAQQRVSSLQSSGELQYRSSHATANVADQIKAVDGGQKAPLPADYSFDNKSGNIQVFYIRDTDDVTREYIVTGADAASTSGSYIIEISPYTGEVYSVIYWENAAYDSLSYQSIVGMMGNRSRDARTDARIGYYGGNELQESIDRGKAVTFTDLKAQLVNWEDLYVKLTSSDLTTAVANPDDLTVSIVVAGRKNYATGSVTLTYSGADCAKVIGVSEDGTPEIDFVLDSMYGDGDDFATVTGGAITPGSDITVSVSVVYDDKTYNKSNTTGLGDQTDNSLFDSLSGGTAKISCLRHLNNIRASICPVVWGVNTFSSVVQTKNGRAGYLAATDDANIDFKASDWQDERVALQHLSTASRKTGSSGVPGQPVSYFEPITTSSSFSGSSAYTFTGKDGTAQYALENFIIGDEYDPEDSTGLFSTVSINLASVTLADVQVYGSDYTGALAGQITDSGNKTTDCHVTTTKKLSDGSFDYATYSVSGDDQVGGLVGATSTALVNCSAALSVSGDDNVGGLCGSLTNGASSACSSGGDPNSSVFQGICSVVGTGDNVGGLLGQMTGGSMDSATAFANVSGASAGSDIGGFVGLTYGWPTITNSGARGDAQLGAGKGLSVVATDGTYAGGFVGRMYGGSTYGCYAAVAVQPLSDVSGTGAFGGFAGSIESAYVTYCYSSGDVKAKTTVGGFVGLLSSSTANICYATSDVNADSVAGGFVGQMNGTWIGSNLSYGRVLKVDGSVGGANNHGFLGQMSGSGYSGTCYYMRMNGYNDRLGDAGQPGSYWWYPGGYLNYAGMASTTVISSSNIGSSQSFPYDDALKGQAFPFKCMVCNGVKMNHYGDWYRAS